MQNAIVKIENGMKKFSDRFNHWIAEATDVLKTSS